MNAITQIFSALTLDKILDAVSEIMAAEKTGSYSEYSLVRSLTQQVNAITGNPYSTDLFLVQTAILREASYRWLEKTKSDAMSFWSKIDGTFEQESLGKRYFPNGFTDFENNVLHIYRHEVLQNII